MAGPRAEKVAVVDEVRDHLAAADAAILTEYRGLKVGDLAALRRALRGAGAEYKVYKNTLVKRATADTPHAVLDALLEGPTAIAFVDKDVAAVAKVLRDFARAHPALVVKGSFVGSGILDARTTNALADLPSRDVLLAQIAGLLAAPLRELAGLLKALPQNLAYGLSALIDQRGGPEAAPAVDAATGAASGGETAAGSDASADQGTQQAGDSANQSSTDEIGGAEAAAIEGTVSAPESAEGSASPSEGTVSSPESAEASAPAESGESDAGETESDKSE